MEYSCGAPVRPSKLIRMSTAGRMRRVFSADEERFIISRGAYDAFRFLG